MKFLNTKSKKHNIKNHISPEGKVWVCMACGKYTKDRFGDDFGWDASCVLNSALFDMKNLIIENGRVVKVV